MLTLAERGVIAHAKCSSVSQVMSRHHWVVILCDFQRYTTDGRQSPRRVLLKILHMSVLTTSAPLLTSRSRRDCGKNECAGCAHLNITS